MITQQSGSSRRAQLSRMFPAALLSLLLASAAAPANAQRTQPAPAGGAAGSFSIYLPVVTKIDATQPIAFESDRDGNPEIYVMNSDGSQQTRLTFNAADDYAPAWSPDGTHIAFTSSRDGGYSIYVMNADGSNQARLTNSNTDSWPAWSPDGSRIVFESFRDGNSEIYVMNADGGGQTRLTTTPEAEEDPEFSPDGTQILYSFLGSDFFNQTMQGEIYVMHADGSNQTRLTFDAANDFYARWSPDGNRIAFFSQRAPGGIFVMQANGSGVMPLVSGDEPDWSADGRRIAFVHGQGIYVAEADGTGAVLIASHMSQDFWPRWHP